MSTNDVPGARAANNDELGLGCWAEHEDGTLLFVESTEADRVIYSVFDTRKNPPMEFRDAMPEDGFKKHFSWDPNSKDDDQIKWTWHDKTPFPWDRIIEEGIPEGVRHASAQHLLTAAEKVAEKRDLIGKSVDEDDIKSRLSKTIVGRVGRAVVSGIQSAISELKS